MVLVSWTGGSEVRPLDPQRMWLRRHGSVVSNRGLELGERLPGGTDATIVLPAAPAPTSDPRRRSAAQPTGA